MRISAARFLIHCGRFIESLAVAWMRPSDLGEFNRRRESVPIDVNQISQAAVYDLSNDERALLRGLPFSPARILLLGDGREKQALVRDGHEVTVAREFSPEAMSGRFDAVWLGGIFYSQIPGRKARVSRLRQIGSAVRPGGHLLCQFLLNVRGGRSSFLFLCQRLFAYLTLGNFQLQEGDAIRELSEFSHSFSSWAEFQDEIREAGFELVYSQKPPAAVHGGAIAKVGKFG